MYFLYYGMFYGDSNRFRLYKRLLLGIMLLDEIANCDFNCVEDCYRQLPTDGRLQSGVHQIGNQDLVSC